MEPTNPTTDQSVTTTLICLAQNRLGAMDRVLGMLTARGYMASRLVASQTSPDRLQIMLTLAVENEKALEKLVKAMYKQIYVIEIQMVMTRDEAVKAENVVTFPGDRMTEPELAKQA
jgi:acetolactate synthase small subunit